MYSFSNLVLELKTPKVVEEEPADKKDPKKKAAAADPKKDPKKKTGPGGKKDEEEDLPKVIPKVRINLSMIEEQSLDEFIKCVRAIQLRTPKLLMLFITLEDAEQLGTDPEEVSIKFLLEKLNQALETTVIWEKDWIINDWADRMENEYYQDEAVILFENLALLPAELGYETITVETQVANPTTSEIVVKQTPKKFRCLYDEIKTFADISSQYANVGLGDIDILAGRLLQLRQTRQNEQHLHQPRNLHVWQEGQRASQILPKILQQSAELDFASPGW